METVDIGEVYDTIEKLSTQISVLLRMNGMRTERYHGNRRNLRASEMYHKITRFHEPRTWSLSPHLISIDNHTQAREIGNIVVFKILQLIALYPRHFPSVKNCCRVPTLMIAILQSQPSVLQELEEQ